MQLYENERCDEVNDSLKLIQKTEGLTFGTDALLLAGYIKGKFKSGLEIGSGSGIITMLLLTRGKLLSADCVEVQEEYATLTRRNAELNGLSDKIRVICGDVRELHHAGEYDLVYTNPPYMKADSGEGCREGAKHIARHEVHGTIGEFCTAAAGLLRFGGTFAVVYRPDRLTDLLFEMRRAGLEPKSITFVHATTEKEASMVLILAKRGGNSGAVLTKPLIIYDNGKYGKDMDYIMENGKFADDFYR